MRMLLLLVALLGFAVPAIAETYMWEDSSGTTNFADDLSQVPKKYRKKVKVLGADEPTPGEAEQSGKPAVEPSKEMKRTDQLKPGDGAPDAKPGKAALFGGKDEKAWKSEFASARWELKSVEDQLAENRSRLNDTSHMSRTEYLSIQNTIKSLEYRVQNLRSKLDDLRNNAAAAGVPAEWTQ